MSEKYWERHEREVAEAIGGEVVAQSGAGPDKLDAKAPRGGWWRWRASCKATTRKSVSVTRAICKELEDSVAFSSAEERPLLALRLYSDNGRYVLHDLVAMTMDDFVELMEEFDRLRGGRPGGIESRSGP